MKHQVHRVGDLNSGGGAIASTQQSTVYANDILCSVDNDPVEPHPGPTDECEGSPRTQCNRNVLIEDIPKCVEGDVDTCSCVRVAGSPDVYADK